MTFPPRGLAAASARLVSAIADANEIVDSDDEPGAKCRRADLAVARDARFKLRRCWRAGETIASRCASMAELPSAITY